MNEENLNFSGFFYIIFKRLWIIILITLIAVSTSAYVSFYMLTPIYQAKVNMLIVGQLDPETPNLNESIEEALKLNITYQDIIKSPLILQNAQLKLKEEGHDIRIGEGGISVTQKTNSQVLELFVAHEDPKKALLIANAVAGSFSEKVTDLMGIDTSNVKIMNNATVNSNPISPNPVLIISITAVISLIVSTWITVLIHYISKMKRVSKTKPVVK